jgi:5'(3')-deoxyribonucleotidase
MDGVLADFDRALYDRGFFNDRSANRLLKQHIDKKDWTETEKKNDETVQGFMSENGFFRNLHMIPGADQLWAAAGNPTVLTARPKVEDVNHRVRDEKRDWITEKFGEIPDERFICCLRSEKKNYAATFMSGYQTSMNILVDDLEWNCSEWRKAGGLSIHFKTMDQAIQELQDVRMLHG